MIACVAWRFWLGALSDIGRARAEKPRGDWAVFIFLAASPFSSAPDKTAMPCGLGKCQHFTANPCQNQPKSPILSKGQKFKFVPLLYKVPRGHVIKK